MARLPVAHLPPPHLGSEAIQPLCRFQTSMKYAVVYCMGRIQTRPLYTVTILRDLLQRPVVRVSLCEATREDQPFWHNILLLAPGPSLSMRGGWESH